jgi:hypothetical protein
MVQTPARQPVRQIIQRHNQDCATGTERTGSDIRLPENQRAFATIRPARIPGLVRSFSPRKPRTRRPQCRLCPEPEIVSQLRSDDQEISE